MRTRPPLAEAYRDLAGQANAHRRGRKFELLVADMFRAAHFHVTVNARAGRPRQTDLVATLGPETYLVETKWETRRAGVSAIDDVRVRLQETHSHVIGVVIGVQGFTAMAVDRVQSKRDRPILLIKGTELERLLEWPQGLRSFLRRKTSGLVVGGAVIFDCEAHPASIPRKRAPLPAADVAMVDVAGCSWTPIDARGGYNDLVFVDDMPNVDSFPAAGFGVVADLPLHPENEDALLGVLTELCSRGWTSNRGRWAIQQAEMNWHGVGLQEFADTLVTWQHRYAPLTRIHHTEQAIYFDYLDGCFYTLSADLRADEFRHVDHCNLSFQFMGVPLDATPIRELAESFEAEGAVYFRSLAGPAVETRGVPRGMVPDLTPLGFLTENDDAEEDSSQRLPIVTGVIVPNPFRDRENCPSWWPIEATETDLLVCGLRSWHPLSEPRTAYHLRRLEWTRTSDAFVFRPQVDWDWKDTVTGRPPWKTERLALAPKRGSSGEGIFDGRGLPDRQGSIARSASAVVPMARYAGGRVYTRSGRVEEALNTNGFHLRLGPLC